VRKGSGEVQVPTAVVTNHALTMGAAAAAGAGAFWWTTVVSRGPIIESTALCAIALPVPKAAPERGEGEG